MSCRPEIKRVVAIRYRHPAKAARRRERQGVIQRRTFLAGSGATLAGLSPSYGALAEQLKRLPVIGFLGSTAPAVFVPFVAAFRQGLNETGYVEGQNVAIEYRWAEDHYERLPGLAIDLVGRKVDVIATASMPSALAAKEATATIPVVFETGIDPVEAGLVASFARPGGNLTGVCMLTAALMPKRLELLSELVPQASASDYWRTPPTRMPRK